MRLRPARRSRQNIGRDLSASRSGVGRKSGAVVVQKCARKSALLARIRMKIGATGADLRKESSDSEGPEPAHGIKFRPRPSQERQFVRTTLRAKPRGARRARSRGRKALQNEVCSAWRPAATYNALWCILTWWSIASRKHPEVILRTHTNIPTDNKQ